MQHDMVRLQADIRVRGEKLQRIEEEEGALQGEHDHLEEKLRGVMEPRIFQKKEELGQQEAALSKTEQDARAAKLSPHAHP